MDLDEAPPTLGGAPSFPVTKVVLSKNGIGYFERSYFLTYYHIISIVLYHLN